MKQLTRDEAIQIHDSKVWENWSDDQVVRFQLYQEFLAVPFGRFHSAVSKVLERDVFTHEFGDQKRLIAEYEGRRPKPTFAEIVAMLPAEKLIVIGTQS